MRRGAALAIFLCAACAGASPAAAPDRTAAVPEGAVKVLPADDPNPPLLLSDEWEEPVPVPGPINTAGAEDSPFVTPDGETLYFWFTPDLSLPPGEQVGDGVTGIWVSHRRDGDWGEPGRVVLSDPGEAALDGCAFVSGDVMWFCSAREGNSRGVDLYTARRVDGEWAEWAHAGATLNVEYGAGEVHLAPDGKTLYFHSARPGGEGGLDVWTTRYEDGGWGWPRNVAAVNTPGDEGWPFISPDGSELWITRLAGAPALYRSRWGPAGWGPPEPIVTRFAGEAALDADGNLYFTHHFYADGVPMESDLYVARRRSGFSRP